MKGKILEINKTDALVLLDNGTTLDTGVSHLPKNTKIGDKVDINFSEHSRIKNDKMNSLF